MGLSSRSSSPMPSGRTRSRELGNPASGTARPRPRGRPRPAARARFSAIERPGDVPASGSWNTRPISLARRCSGQPLSSRPASRMVPASMGNAPATALSVVLLPDPLVPITTTKLPGSIASSRPRRARTSSGVPGLKVFQTSHISSNAISSAPHGLCFEAVRKRFGQHERRKHKDSRDELQIIGVETPAARRVPPSAGTRAIP